MTEKDIELLAYFRSTELSDNKNLVKQTFDVQHLKSIHAYLFQDSQQERKAGEFRPIINDVHSKRRSIYPIQKPFYYSPFPAENTVNTTISTATDKLKSASTLEQKTQIISNMYSDLDY
ncbi:MULTISPECIES: hypothetical protein [unclassified Acinetobacter]|uniref:hypothetical protein n=1 Tax=unclassified Acinetobacter TaxID=196816 RepID=UPI0035B75B28